MNVFPLSYSAPEEIFRLSGRPRTKLVADLVPGDRSTYIYDNEEDYYNMYQEARFGITHKKSSWDCLRHYEVIANGAIPLFRDVDEIPENTMANFPRHLVAEANRKFNENTLSDKEYFQYSKELFEYGKDNLTSEKAALYFLRKMNKTEKMVEDLKVLMLCGDVGYRKYRRTKERFFYALNMLPGKDIIALSRHDFGYKAVNYMRETLSLGLRRALGSKFVDYPKNMTLYVDCPDLSLYMGRGYTYGGRLKDSGIDRTNIEKRIDNGEFDLIVYGQPENRNRARSLRPLNQLEYWPTVERRYTKDQIAFLFGSDRVREKDEEDLVYMTQYGSCFVNELA